MVLNDALIKKRLRKIVALAHEPIGDDDFESWSGPDGRGAIVTSRCADAIKTLADDLERDEGYEHLKSPTEELRGLVSSVLHDKLTPAVAAEAFVREHRREASADTFWVAVEGLSVDQVVELGSCSLLPVGHDDVPAATVQPLGRADSIARVDVTGSSTSKQVARGRALVAADLRTLRACLLTKIHGTSRQLRFRVGMWVLTSSGGVAWQRPKDEVIDLPLSATDADMAFRGAVGQVLASNAGDLGAAMRLALYWVDHAVLSTDHTVAANHFFSAREALLSRRADLRKAAMLATRQALLSHVMTGGFPHPAAQYLAYAEGRSKSVHGSAFAPVSETERKKLGSRTVEMLVQVAELAVRENFVRRGQVLDYLDGHSDLVTLLDWLRSYGYTQIAEEVENELLNNDQVRTD